eukprot:CAMPEP_0197437596 /NCGR_PEP_ID=MMETSP1175-20131217/4809_1 /TAXON_ID=1003142 /ORGANISM="Triceratium dubium, Strain CCMP147" /LENGTH=442 /DNA_ID=CAMNT_0042967167 /DNA_START=66 /DNA_END=1395 /DNA_ORIENTATION=+
MVNSEPPRIAAPTTVPPPSPPLTFLTDGAVGLGFVVYLVALAATAAAVAILSYRRTGTASRGNRGEDVVPQPTTAAAVFPHLAPKPPPPPTLFVLLSLRPSDPSSRSLYDDFIFRAVQADPSAAAKKHNFPLGHGRKSAPMYPLSMACCLGASLRTVRALYRAYPDAIAHHDSQNSYAPIHWAVRYSKESQVDPEVLRLLASIYIHSGESGPKHPLRVAIMYGAGPDAIKILADLWAHDRRARARVLHLAVEHSASVEACRALLDAFPDAIAARDQEKCTPLHAALKHGAGEDVVALFIEAAAANLGGNGGEVLRMSDREGNTPLHVACAARAPLGVLQSIVEVDPSLVRLTNNQGKAPLHLLRDALTKKEQQTELSFAEESSLRERIYLLLETSYGEVVAADEDAPFVIVLFTPQKVKPKASFVGTSSIQIVLKDGLTPAS